MAHLFRQQSLWLPLISLVVGLAVFATADTAYAKKEDSAKIKVLAPGWGDLKYDPPTPGSYELPKIRKAPEGGDILLSNGKPVRLSDYFDDKLTILTFIYTRCNDVNGCPLATFVLHALQKSLHGRQDLEDKVRFISMSFDPDNDTPKALQEYATEFDQASGHEWLFATTESDEKLKPILEGYGQYTFKMKSEDGKSAFAHILRAYLIDKEGYIRNIYSVDFLHPKILLADIETVILENQKAEAVSSSPK